MNLDINEDWRLRSDERCIILEQRIVRTRKSDSKDGEHKKGEHYETWVPSYHANVRQALRKLYDEGLRGVEGVEELRAATDRLEAAIEKVGDKLGARDAAPSFTGAGHGLKRRSRVSGHRCWLHRHAAAFATHPAIWPDVAGVADTHTRKEVMPDAQRHAI